MEGQIEEDGWDWPACLSGMFDVEYEDGGRGIAWRPMLDGEVWEAGDPIAILRDVARAWSGDAEACEWTEGSFEGTSSDGLSRLMNAAT